MSVDVGAYHVLELQIASDPADLRRVMPAIRAEHERILDVGCGAGQTLIASTLGANVTALGIDCDLRALRLGRRLDPRIRFICSKGEALPLGSEYFDLVISRVALPYMDTRPALGEMTRVLKPGGTIWIALHPLARLLQLMRGNLRRMELLRALHRLYVLANGALAHFTGREFRSPLTGRFESFQTSPGIRRELQRLGFENIKLDERAFFVVTATKAKRAA